MRKKLKIMYTNADQLTKKKKRELDELVSTEEPHIIAICEVKPKKWKEERLIQDYVINDYSPYETNALNKVGRGIVILIHKSMKNLVLEVRPTLDFQEVYMLKIKMD